VAMPDNLESPADRRFQNPAPADAPTGPLMHRAYRGGSVTVYQWRCAGEQHDSSRDEWSDGYEIVVPRRGTFAFQVEGERCFADRTSTAFFHPEEAYRVRHPLPGGDAGTVFRLAPEAVVALVGEYDAADGDREPVRFPARAAPLDGRGYLLHRQVMEAIGSAASNVMELEECAIAFVREAMAQAYRRAGHGRRGPAGRNRKAGEYTRRVQEVVAARYREPLTLAEVARAVETSPFHLSRLVASVAGVPIHRLIVRHRLRDALERLLETHDSITAVALATGFASHSHLTDAFRREYGLPPSAVRRAWRRR
jgi:AraC family transcriptional regulator